MPARGNRLLLALFVAVATNVVGFTGLSVEKHVAQLMLAAIIPGLTIALAYRSLAPGQEALTGGTRIEAEAG
jgi:hypothetical protein